MTKRNTVYKLLAVTLVVAMQSLLIPAVAGPQTASVSGKIIAADTNAPMEGAKLHVADPISGEMYSSQITDADGSYSIAGLPAATYELAVEADGGLYLAGPPLQLMPGQTRDLNVAVNANATPATTTAGAAGAWDSPLVAALIVVGSAVVIGLIIDDATKEDDVSPN